MRSAIDDMRGRPTQNRNGQRKRRGRYKRRLSSFPITPSRSSSQYRIDRSAPSTDGRQLSHQSASTLATSPITTPPAPSLDRYTTPAQIVSNARMRYVIANLRSIPPSGSEMVWITLHTLTLQSSSLKFYVSAFIERILCNDVNFRSFMRSNSKAVRQKNTVLMRS